MRIIYIIKKWYNGTYIHYESHAIIGGYTSYHWTAKIARRLVKFYFDNWKWIWTTGFFVLFALLKIR